MANIAGTIAPTFPSDTTALHRYHLLEVNFKSSTELNDRWNSPSATAVIFTGLIGFLSAARRSHRDPRAGWKRAFLRRLNYGRRAGGKLYGHERHGQE